jgi:hypothetical protein
MLIFLQPSVTDRRRIDRGRDPVMNPFIQYVLQSRSSLISCTFSLSHQHDAIVKSWKGLDGDSSGEGVIEVTVLE